MRDIKNLVKRYENLIEMNSTVSDEYLGVSSFYMLPTGQYLNCKEECGYRSDDHRVIFGATKLANPYKDNKAWNKLQCNYQLIRIVPEYPCVMIDKHQVITKEQQIQLDILTAEGFEIEYYL